MLIQLTAHDWRAVDIWMMCMFPVSAAWLNCVFRWRSLDS